MAFAEVKRLWRLRSVRVAVALLAFAAVTAFSYEVAHTRIYINFPYYDDEGYMLIALKSFVNHGHLYDDVFTQYGPFYYELWDGMYSLFGLSVNHDNGRFVTAVVWVLTSLTLGLAVWRLARSALIGLATQMLVFGALLTLVDEPMHPGGLVVLLLAAIVAISCFVKDRESPLTMAVLGGAMMALILVKINVGAFAFSALALACVVSYPALAARRWIRPLVEIAFVAIPLVLVTSKAGDPWARQYGVHVAVAALAVVVALRARASGRRSTEELWWLLGGLVVVGAVVCLAIVGAGTSPGGLFDGLIKQPLHQADAFSIPLYLSKRVYLYDFIALAAAVAYWYVGRGRDTPAPPAAVAVGALLSILVGLTMALSVIGRTLLLDHVGFDGFPLGMLAFAWVGLVEFRATADDRTAFGRLLLPPLAALQALHAYPVAGSQIQWSAVLLIPVGALCLANGVRGLVACLGQGRERTVVFALGASLAAILLAVLVNIQLRKPLHEYRLAHDGTVSLGLPGAEQVRVSPEEAQRYHAVVAAIDRNCDSFVSLPGMNSFYFWTELEPPTRLNATAWPALFDDATQRRIIDKASSIDRLCLLRDTPLAESWGPVEGPLVEWLDANFRPLVTIGDYELLNRESHS